MLKRAAAAFGVCVGIEPAQICARDSVNQSNPQKNSARIAKIA